MARFVTGPELEALVDEYIGHHMLDDPEVKSMVKELDKGIAKLFSEIEEANKELKLREIVPTVDEVNTSETDTAIPSNEPDDIIYIGKVLTDSPVHKQPRPELGKDMKVLAKRKKDDLWYDATVLELLSNQHSQVKVKVKFDAKGSRGIFSCKHIALKNKLKWKDLAVGSRIVAKYENDADVSMKQCLYAGIIAETPLPYNKRKFLVFFDDGFAQYMDCDQIYKVYEASSCVWEDVHEDSREFIKEYLEKYPERPMVRVSEGQFLKTEWRGSWWKTRVLKVQGSLVNMLFLIDERTEWIYRGSPRLEPLHRELMAAEASRQAGKVIRGISHTVVKRNAPVVEYINVETPTLVNPEERSKQTARKSSKNRKLYRQRLQREEEDRQSEMNKQSVEEDDDLMIVETPRYTFIPPDSTDHKSNHKSILQQKDNKSVGKRLQSGYDSSGNEASGDSFRKSKKVSISSYECHKCSALCVVAVKNQVDDLKDENPLRWPQIVGWQRELSGKRGSGKKTVFYRTPCMKRLRNLEDVSMYLKQTDIKYLAIDNFTFDPFVYTIPRSAGRSCLWGKEAKVIIKDISNGAEMVPIMLVNEVDYERPDESYHYITYRKCKKAIINTDPNFLVCCDCKDDCKDRSKCACQQLTVGATRSSRDGKVDPNAGYKYRRLEEQLPTGIFECNSKCKCSKNCYNRVAQNGVRVRLQVFKTEKRGWGLRCIDDIEAGMFICTYAGNLWNEEEANDFGRKFGDEYFAELDYIDVVEKNKEGYESDVASSEGYESETSDSSCNSDADYRGYRTDSGGSSPYYPPSADDASVDEGYAATQTKSGTRILLRRKSANNGNQPVKESWSVVDSPQKVLKRTNSEPCFSKSSLDSEKKSSSNDSIIVISSDEDDYLTSAPTCNKDSVPTDLKHANLAKAIKKEQVSTGVKNNKKDDKPDNNTGIKIEKKQESLTSKVPRLDDEDHQYLEKALTAIFTGHTDDEEALENIKAVQDVEKKNATELSKVGGIDYGYNVAPREVVDNKAIIAYRERRRKKKLKLDDDIKSSTNESSGKDSPSTYVEDTGIGSSNTNLQSKPQIGVQDCKPLKPPEISNQLSIEAHDSSEPVVEASKSTVTTEIPAQTAQSTLLIESELSSSDSEDEKASVESGDSTNKNKLRTAKKSTHTRLSLTKSPSYTTQKMSFNVSKKDNEEIETPSFPRTRSLFGEEHCYVMDAKREGNLGRYFNHGCVPNLFVQNVFVDTHDLRFPWLAFFAGQNIRAGSELTWDYGYEVGSVANKTLYCYCGSVDCRGRLL